MLEMQYISAFNRCYPQKRVDVKPRFNKQGQFIGYAVGIDGDFGNIVLTVDDMREAIRGFTR